MRAGFLGLSVGLVGGNVEKKLVGSRHRYEFERAAQRVGTWEALKRGRFGDVVGRTCRPRLSFAKN